MPFFSRTKRSKRSAESQKSATPSSGCVSPKHSTEMGSGLMPHRDLRSDMALRAGEKYYGDQRFSDFTIKCQGKEYHVHRIIISSQSKWFEACCTAPFLEASNRSVTLIEDDPAAVDCMIEYFYRGEYDTKIGAACPSASVETGPTGTSQLHAYVYAVAEKYDCTGLKQHALREFNLHLRRANQNQMMAATRAVYQQIELPESDTGLKSALLDFWHFRRAHMSKRQPLETLLKEVPEFAMDVAMKYICPADEPSPVLSALAPVRRPSYSAIRPSAGQLCKDAPGIHENWCWNTGCITYTDGEGCEVSPNPSLHYYRIELQRML